MITIKEMEIPKNCVECNNIGLQQIIGCELICSGCANCGRHPNCPLVEIVTCKDCKYTRQNDDNERYCDLSGRYYDPDYFCADGERRE